MGRILLLLLMTSVVSAIEIPYKSKECYVYEMPSGKCLPDSEFAFADDRSIVYKKTRAYTYGDSLADLLIEANRAATIEVATFQFLYYEGGQATVEGTPEERLIGKKLGSKTFTLKPGVNLIRAMEVLENYPRNTPVTGREGKYTVRLTRYIRSDQDIKVKLSSFNYFDSSCKTIQDKYGVYGFHQVLDGRLNTVFAFSPECIEKNQHAFKARISFDELTEKNWDKLNLYIDNGYAATESQYQKNARLQQVKVRVKSQSFNQPVEKIISLPDKREKRRLLKLSDLISKSELQKLSKANSDEIQIFIYLTPISVYPGSTYTDICISELEWRLEDK